MLLHLKYTDYRISILKISILWCVVEWIYVKLAKQTLRMESFIKGE